MSAFISAGVSTFGVVRRFAPRRTKRDRVAVKQFMTASMIEKNREYTSDFRTTALRQWQTAKP
jgi:hypothetical protein